jgi:hypothetical protein
VAGKHGAATESPAQLEAAVTGDSPGRNSLRCPPLRHASRVTCSPAHGPQARIGRPTPPSLLSIDPLAALAQTQDQLRDRLLELTPAVSPDLQAAWEAG